MRKLSTRRHAGRTGLGAHVGFFTQRESVKEYFQIPVEFATEHELHLKNV
jgi:hypothetical protein